MKKLYSLIFSFCLLAGCASNEVALKDLVMHSEEFKALAELKYKLTSIEYQKEQNTKFAQTHIEKPNLPVNENYQVQLELLKQEVQQLKVEHPELDVNSSEFQTRVDDLRKALLDDSTIELEHFVRKKYQWKFELLKEYHAQLALFTQKFPSVDAATYQSWLNEYYAKN